jgi:hypothetical protein
VRPETKNTLYSTGRHNILIAAVSAGVCHVQKKPSGCSNGADPVDCSSERIASPCPAGSPQQCWLPGLFYSAGNSLKNRELPLCGGTPVGEKKARRHIGRSSRLRAASVHGRHEFILSFDQHRADRTGPAPLRQYKVDSRCARHRARSFHHCPVKTDNHHIRHIHGPPV